MEDNKVKIIIDGKNYLASKGASLMKACGEAGLILPALCYLENVSEEAACSLCIVEVRGARNLLRACITKVSEGMEIWTDTERVKKARKINLELILSTHPLDCMTCEKDGDCLLQDLAYSFGIKKSRYLNPDKIFEVPKPGPWETNPFIGMSQQKCILCGRCVQACANQAVLEAISFSGRGYNEKVSTPFGIPLEETNCQFCGVCLQACPVGALIEKPRIGQGRKKDLTSSETICAYCGVGCNLRIFKDRTNRLIMAQGIYGNKINDGRTCVKGRFGFEYVNSKDRLTKPLIKEHGSFREATWEEAIKFTAEKLSSVKEKYGPQALGVLGSSKCTNEDNYLVQKLARAVLGTNNVDNCARLCHSSTVSGLGFSFGAGAATNSIAGIPDSDLFFVIGSNMSESHPVLAQLVKGACGRGKKAQLIVSDPRRIGLAKYADLFLQLRPGTDVALLNGIMHQILVQGKENREFIEAHTENFEALKKVLEKYDSRTAAEITGIESGLITKAAEMIGSAKALLLFYTMGITQHTTGVDNVLSVANLVLLTGNIGRPGAGLMPLRGQANVQGACDMGVLPDLLPGYQKVGSPEVLEKFEAAWGVKLPVFPGLCVTEFVEKINQGRLRAVHIMGENPLMSEPDLTEVRKAYEKLDFLSVQDIFLSETAALADVVFPSAAGYEKSGSFTNTDRTVQLLRPALEKPRGTKFDWEIVREISGALGYKMEYADSAEILAEISRLIPSFGGISQARLEKGGLQWPCPEEKHPGTPILHPGGKFKTANGKGLFSGVEYKPARELPDEEYPFILTTGRILYHYHSGNETRRVHALNKFVPENYAELHPEDARWLGINNNEFVEVTSRRGRIKVKAKISDRPGRGVIFIPFHFRESAANLLTNPVLDPKSRIPEYKVCAVRISK